jgi:hypothetical protein
MKTIIPSDIYTNLMVLEAILKNERDFGRCLFPGDALSYEAFPKHLPLKEI